MGRVKLRVRKIETPTGRQVTYSKRKVGLTKKVMELSILCDIDIALLMFSPSGKPTLCTGINNDLTSIMERVSHLSTQEIMKRRLEVLEALRRKFKKYNHHVDVERLLCAEDQRVEELRNHFSAIQACSAERNSKLSYWLNPENTEDMVELMAMEENIVESISRLKRRKVHLIEERMHRIWGTHQQPQQYYWIPEHQSANEIPVDPNLAATHGNFGFWGNASGAIENTPSAFGSSSHYPYQQPSYNFSQAMDLNLNNPRFNQYQQFNRMGHQIEAFQPNYGLPPPRNLRPEMDLNLNESNFNHHQLFNPMGAPFEAPRPNYNFAGVGNLRPEMDLNQINPGFNHLQQSNPMGPAFGPYHPYNI